MKPPKHSTRTQELEELVGVIRSSCVRLADAAAHFDQNPKSPLAVPNMATPIRALLCTGRGNSLIQRVVTLTGNSTPTIAVSSPVNEGAEITLSVGRLPSKAYADAQLTTLSIQEFIQAKCLCIDHEHEKVSLSWDELLRGVSEKRGYIHTDAEIPRFFDGVDSFQISGFSLVDFLFRKAAAVASIAAVSALRDLSATDIPTAIDLDPPNSIISYYFETRGIFAPTAKQKEYQDRFDLAVSETRDPNRVIESLQALHREIQDYQSLFYLRLRAAIDLRLGIVQSSLGRHLAAQLSWSKILQQHKNTQDEFLRKVVVETKLRTFG